MRKLGLCLALITMCLPMVSSAQNAVPSVIPYTGYLEANGREGAGSIQMRFALFSDADGNNELWRSWSDDATWHEVDLSAGRFNVNLGGVGQDNLDEDRVFNSDTHYLQIYIRAGTPPTPHTLPLQALKSVPKAVLAQRATNFTVTQTPTTEDLTVRNTVQGNLTLAPESHLVVNNRGGRRRRDSTGRVAGGSVYNYLKGNVNETTAA